MAMTAGREDDTPMMDINTTPLIDVMLVLLIMFIITIPLQTHAVKLMLPGPGKPQASAPPLKKEIVVNAQDQVLWNGAPVSLIVLRQYLDASQTMDPIPELHVRPDAQARYVLVDKVLAVAKRAHVEKMGFVGNERYANL